MKMKWISALSAPAILASTLGFSTVPASSVSKVDLDHGSGQVEFRAIGKPSAIKIVGKGSAPHGDFRVVDGTKVSGTATFDLTSLDTGIEIRTRHMKEKYLEVQKYPQAKLTITQLNLPKPLTDGTKEEGVPFAGKLLLHGVEHAVNGTTEVKKSGDKVEMNSEFGLKIADYGIAQPSFAGITMADEVQVAVTSVAPVVASAGTAARASGQ